MKYKSETATIVFEGRIVEVKIVYNQKFMTKLKISKFNKLTIYTFKTLKLKKIYEIMRENKDTIFKAWNKLEQIKNGAIKIENDEVLIFGKKYKKSDIDYDYEYQKALDYILELFHKYHKMYNFPKVTVGFKAYKSYWGLCNYVKNIITLNSFLTFVPIECVEYVILHELSHLYVHDHSERFYNELKKYCPEYNKARKELRKYTHLL